MRSKLALKAYLWSFNIDVRRTHKLATLYVQCRNRKLRIRSDDRTGIANIVVLLDSNIESTSFRYSGFKGEILCPNCRGHGRKQMI